jgi:hypothetical protein
LNAESGGTDDALAGAGSSNPAPSPANLDEHQGGSWQRARASLLSPFVGRCFLIVERNVVGDAAADLGSHVIVGASAAAGGAPPLSRDERQGGSWQRVRASVLSLFVDTVFTFLVFCHCLQRTGAKLMPQVVLFLIPHRLAIHRQVRVCSGGDHCCYAFLYGRNYFIFFLL